MKIAEIWIRFDISSDALQYYERCGSCPRVNRNESGIRDYNQMDLKRVEFIKWLRSADLPIEALIEYISLVLQGDKTTGAMKGILKEQRK